MLEVLLCGFLDRIRGDHFDLFSKAIEKLTYGWLIAQILGHPFDIQTIIIAIGFAAGMSPGWGGPIGAALVGNGRNKVDDWESWELGILRKNVWLALAFRGLMAGALLLPIGIYQVSIAYAVAFPLAIVLANLVARITKKEHGDWGHQEYFRGWIGGAIIYAGIL